MRYIFGIVILLALAVFFYLQVVFMEEIPRVQPLEVTQNDQSIGYGVALNNQLGVMPRHLYHESVLVGGRKIEIINEDPVRDMVLWRSNFRMPHFDVTLSETKHGDIFYLQKNGKVKRVWLDDKSVSAQFDEVRVEDIWVFTGKIEPGDSGRPITNQKGEVRAMIIGGKISEDLIYAVPSEVWWDMVK